LGISTPPTTGQLAYLVLCKALLGAMTISSKHSVPGHLDRGRRPDASARRAVGAAVIGNVLEWYDFVVYGYLASIIATKFFPTESETASLLAVFAAFGVGFVFRPLGAIAIGRIGDRKGRKVALVLTVMLMAGGTVLIGLLPPYDAVGIAAPLALVAARLIQGFAIGGEWGASIAYLVEVAPENRRGFYASLQQMTVVTGLLMGSGISAILATLLDPAALQAWGWRIPFLIGGLVVPVGFYMRRKIAETSPYLQSANAATSFKGTVPIVEAAQVFGVSLVWSVAAYIFLVYMPTFTEKYAGLSHSAALWSNSLGLLLLMIFVPVFGAMSDRIGRKPLLLAGCLAFVVLPFPLFSLMLGTASIGVIVMVQAVFGIAVALLSGPAPAALAEVFETPTRMRGLSTANAIAAAIFGGFAPFIATWLIATTGSPIAPVGYVIACAVVSALVTLTLRETARRQLG
jgi:MFS transporter, MHS family, proline/betaine transporter